MRTGSSAVSDSCNRRVRYSCEAFLKVLEQSFDGDSDEAEEDDDESCDWEADRWVASSAIVDESELYYRGISCSIQRKITQSEKRSMDRDGERVRPGRNWFAFVFPRLGLVWGLMSRD